MSGKAKLRAMDGARVIKSGRPDMIMLDGGQEVLYSVFDVRLRVARILPDANGKNVDERCPPISSPALSLNEAIPYLCLSVGSLFMFDLHARGGQALSKLHRAVTKSLMSVSSYMSLQLPRCLSVALHWMFSIFFSQGIGPFANSDRCVSPVGSIDRGSFGVAYSGGSRVLSHCRACGLCRAIQVQVLKIKQREPHDRRCQSQKLPPTLLQHTLRGPNRN